MPSGSGARDSMKGADRITTAKTSYREVGSLVRQIAPINNPHNLEAMGGEGARLDQQRARRKFYDLHRYRRRNLPARNKRVKDKAHARTEATNLLGMGLGHFGARTFQYTDISARKFSANELSGLASLKQSLPFYFGVNVVYEQSTTVTAFLD